MNAELTEAEPRPLVERQEPLSNDPLAIVSRAIDAGTDPDKLGKLIDLAEKMQAIRAREQFGADMSDCQAMLPAVMKNLENKEKHAMYASLDEMQRAAIPVITRHGFALSFSQDAEPLADGRHHMILDIMHRGGHVERKHGFYRLDGKGAKGGAVMSDIQGDVSTHTYAQRDMLRMAFFIQVGGLDRDGEPTNGGNGFSEEDEAELLKLLADHKAKKVGPDYPLAKWEAWYKSWLVWLNVQGLSELDAKGFQKARNDLRERLNKLKGGKP